VEMEVFPTPPLKFRIEIRFIALYCKILEFQNFRLLEV
jgi:hypothetical protein